MPSRCGLFSMGSFGIANLVPLHDKNPLALSISSVGLFAGVASQAAATLNDFSD